MVKKTILVVDDDKEIAGILRDYLAQAGFDVLLAYDGALALATLRSERPDLLLLDLMLPDKDGWELTRIIRSDSKLNQTPIIMVTARVEDTDKIIGLELGADDYVTKPFNAREVVARVRALLRLTDRMQSVPAQRISLGRLLLDLDSLQLFVDGQEVELTPAEFKLMQKFMENPGHTFRREELLVAAVGYGYEGMDRTLNTHILNLRKKIELDPSDPIYIQTVYSIGYRFSRDL
ncbi:MAG: response regulator transcription factor [Anaerolineae bacterium]